MISLNRQEKHIGWSDDASKLFSSYQPAICSSSFLCCVMIVLIDVIYFHRFVLQYSTSFHYSNMEAPKKDQEHERSKTADAKVLLASSDTVYECIDTNDTACYNLIADIVNEREGHYTMTEEEDYILTKKIMRDSMRGKTEDQKRAILAKKLSEIKDKEKYMKERKKG